MVKVNFKSIQKFTVSLMVSGAMGYITYLAVNLKQGVVFSLCAAVFMALCLMFMLSENSAPPPE
jgi:hypothetical protein